MCCLCHTATILLQSSSQLIMCCIALLYYAQISCGMLLMQQHGMYKQQLYFEYFSFHTGDLHPIRQLAQMTMLTPTDP